MAVTEQAEELAAAARELGCVIAATHAAAWRARVDPEVTAGLAGAAVALYVSTKALFSRGKPLPNDQVMVGQAEDLQIDTSEMLRATRTLRENCATTLDRLYEAHRAAIAHLQRVQGGKEQGDQAVIRERIRDLELQIADCEVALEILADLAGRLAYARGCLQRVPDDLSETYEAAYWLLHRGHRLPRDGDFLTGTPATPDHPHHALSR